MITKSIFIDLTLSTLLIACLPPAATITTPASADEAWHDDCAQARPELIGNFFPQSNVVEFKGSIYFQAWDNDHGRVFMQYDGTQAQAVKGRNLDTIQYLDDFIVYQDKLYFSAKHDIKGRDLWRYDGDTAELVEDKEPFTFAPAAPIIYQDELYFRGMGSDHLRLYRYDGHAITLVEGIGYPGSKTVHRGKLLVHGHRDPEGSGLYSFDGTTVQFLLPMIGMGPVTTLGDDETLYFLGTQHVFSSAGSLWKFGPNGLQQVGKAEASIYGRLIHYKNALYYRGNGGELWRYDGKQEVALPNTGHGSDDPIVFHDRLYFMGSHNNRHELFSYDGDQVSLALIINSEGDVDARPDDFLVFKDQLYFSAWQAKGWVGFWRMVCDGQP